MNNKSDIKLKDLEDMSVTDMNNLSQDDYAELKRQRQDINRHADQGTTAQDLRDQVMDHTIHMIKKLQSQLYAESEPITAPQAMAYDKLWPVIEDIIKQTSDLKKIEAENASDIIKLIATGKITLKDAAVMMTLLQSKIEIEELPKLIAQLEDSNG